MIPHYRKKAAIAGLVGLSGVLVVGILSEVIHNDDEPYATAQAIVAFCAGLSLLYASGAYAQAKDHSSGIGGVLALLGPLGWLILFLLKDRSNWNDK